MNPSPEIYVLAAREYVHACKIVVAHQAPLSMEFSRQAYWSGLPFPSPGDLPDPGTERASLMSLALAGGFFTTSATWEALQPERGVGNSLSPVPRAVRHKICRQLATAFSMMGAAGVVSEMGIQKQE